MSYKNEATLWPSQMFASRADCIQYSHCILEKLFRGKNVNLSEI